MSDPRFELSNTVIDSTNAQALAGFYQALLGWRRTTDNPDWITLAPADGGAGLSFQTEPEYIKPTWPSTTAHQQMSLHLDIATDDLAAAVDRAIELGATAAEWQPQNDVRVMLDPAGHPFCLFLTKF